MSVDEGLWKYLKNPPPHLLGLGEEGAYRAGYAQCLADLEAAGVLYPEEIEEFKNGGESA